MYKILRINKNVEIFVYVHVRKKESFQMWKQELEKKCEDPYVDCRAYREKHLQTEPFNL